MLRVFVLLLVLFPATCFAGAWPRGAKNVYLDLSFFQYPSDENGRKPTTQIYLEIGLTKTLTFALDAIYHPETEQYTGIASLIYALPDWGKPFRLSFGAGIGKATYTYTIREDVFELRAGRRIQTALIETEFIEQQDTTQVSAHFGWGFKKGWFSTDAYYRVYNADQYALTKVDVTAGLNISRRFSASLQVQYGHSPIIHYVNLAPKITYNITPHFAVLAGGTHDLKSGYESIRMGIVLEF